MGSKDAVIGRLIALLDVDSSALDKGIQQTGKKISSSTSIWTKEFNAVSLAFDAMISGYAVRKMLDIGSSFLTAGLEVDRYNSMLRVATGSEKEATKAKEYLRAESERLGLVYWDQIRSYGQLSAATRGTRLEGEETRKIWTSLAEAGVALRLSGDDMNGVFRAVTQVMSKGKLQAEEIRGQIGERLPGAFNLAAEAMGMTTAELSKSLEMGQVYSDEFLPKFAKALHDTYGRAAVDAASGLTSEMNRLADAWKSAQNDLMDAGGIQVAVNAVRAFQSVIKPVVPLAADIGGRLADLLDPTALERLEEQSKILNSEISRQRARIEYFSGPDATKEQTAALNEQLKVLERQKAVVDATLRKEWSSGMPKPSPAFADPIGYDIDYGDAAELLAADIEKRRKILEKWEKEKETFRLTDTEKEVYKLEKEYQERKRWLGESKELEDWHRIELAKLREEEAGDWIKYGNKLKDEEIALKIRLAKQANDIKRGELEDREKLEEDTAKKIKELDDGLHEDKIKMLKAQFETSRELYADLYDDIESIMEDHSNVSAEVRGVYFAWEEQKLQEQLQAYKDNLNSRWLSEEEKANATILLKEWEARKVEELEQKKILASDDFFAGFKVGLDQSVSDMQTWAEVGASLAKTMTSSMTSSFSDFINPLSDEFLNFGSLVDNVFNSMVNAAADAVAKMAVEWAIAEGMSFLQNIFHEGNWNVGQDEVLATLRQGEIVFDPDTSDRIRDIFETPQAFQSHLDALSGGTGTFGGYTEGIAAEAMAKAAVMNAVQAAAAVGTGRVGISGAFEGLMSPAAIANIGVAGVEALSAAALGLQNVGPVTTAVAAALSALGQAAFGPGGAVVGSLAGKELGELVGDIVNVREDEAIKDMLEDKMGWGKAHQAYDYASSIAIEDTYGSDYGVEGGYYGGVGYGYGPEDPTGFGQRGYGREGYGGDGGTGGTGGYSGIGGTGTDQGDQGDTSGWRHGGWSYGPEAGYMAKMHGKELHLNQDQVNAVRELNAGSGGQGGDLVLQLVLPDGGVIGKAMVENFRSNPEVRELVRTLTR